MDKMVNINRVEFADNVSLPRALCNYLKSKFARRYNLAFILYLLYKLYMYHKHDEPIYGALIVVVLGFLLPMFIILIFSLMHNKKKHRVIIDDSGIWIKNGYSDLKYDWCYFNSYKENESRFIYKNSKGLTKEIFKGQLNLGQQDFLRELSETKIDVKSAPLSVKSLDGDGNEVKTLEINTNSTLKDYELARQYRFFHSFASVAYYFLALLPMALVAKFCLVRKLNLDDSSFILVVSLLFFGMILPLVIVRAIAVIDQVVTNQSDRKDFWITDEYIEFYSKDPFGATQTIDWASLTLMKETKRHFVLFNNRKIVKILSKRFFSKEDLEKIKRMKPVAKLSQK